MIVPMKKAKLVFLKEDEEAMLKAIQKSGELMVIRTETNHDAFDSSEEDAFIQRSQKTLQTLKPFAQKGKPFGIGEWTEVKYDNFVNPSMKEAKVIAEIEEIDSNISKLKGEIDSTKEAIKFLTPWNDLDGKLSAIYNAKYVDIHVGYVPLRQIEEFKQGAKDLKGEVKIFGVAEDNQAVMIVNWHADDAEAMESVKQYGFIDAVLPNEDKTVKQLISEKQSLISNNQTEITNLEGKLKDLAAKNEKAIKIFNDQMATKSVLKKTPVTTTVETVYMEGWVRFDRTKKFESAVASVTKDFDLEFSEPEKDDVVPTALSNNGFVQPFESLTDMYSRPNVNELDPNPVMSIWYWLIFGMMMGDAGYGLVLALGSGLMIKIMKPKGGMASLLKIFFFGSITTLIWGIVFGSYFGASWFKPLWMNPQEEPIKMLIFTMVVGVLHLINGLIMKAIMEIKAGHLKNAIFDQFSWILILIGGSLCLSKFCGNMISPDVGASIPQAIITAGFIIAGVGALIVLLTAGRDKKGIVGKAIGGALGLYGITSWLSDVLSYSRILALAMSGAIIGYVMNLLAGMVQDMIPVVGIVFAIIIYIGGHIFNIAMSLLSAYVHASRLQYIEFYGKFYEGGGVDFKPLTLDYKYINEVK